MGCFDRRVRPLIGCTLACAPPGLLLVTTAQWLALGTGWIEMVVEALKRSMISNPCLLLPISE